MRNEGIRRGQLQRVTAEAAEACQADGSRFALSWLLAAGLLLLATVLLGTGSIAWAELRRPAARSALDPARYEALLDVPRLPVERVSFGVGPFRQVPPAVLRIPRLQIEVAVNGGTDSDALFRGAGLLAGSARPGSTGHVGLAMHRDRHFRRLRELVPGDVIALDTVDSTRHYRVTRLTLSSATGASLLAADAGPVLTLVTSHPFDPSYRASPRFVVRAELVARPQATSVSP
jgi:LPXTG-site transpeptidase (sortase) family protein